MAEFDPDNPTFYGACIAIYDAANIDGAPLDPDSPAHRITYLYDDEEYATVEAGQTFRVAMWSADFREPRPSQTDALDFTWVIECGAGSNGALRLRDGTDVDWNPATATTSHDLGVFPVSGQTRIAVPTDVPTVQEVVGGSAAPILEVACVSGSVQVRQVRMRVWPVGGPRGAWVADPGGASRVGRYEIHQSGPGEASVTKEQPRKQGWDDEGNLTGYGPQATVNGGSTNGGFAGEFDDGFVPMAVALSNSAPPPYEYFRQMEPYAPWDFGSIFTSWGYSRWRDTATGGFEWFGKLGCGAAVLAYTPSIITSTPDSWTDPDRIYWEDSAQVRATDGRAAQRSFLRWKAGPILEAGDPRIGVGLMLISHAPGMSYKEESYWGGAGRVVDYLTSEPLPASTSGAITYGGMRVQLTLPDQPVVALELKTTLFDAAPRSLSEFEWTSAPGVNSTGGDRWLTLSATEVLEVDPPYEYFNPALPWVDEQPTPRFFWKDELDQWRAIGPGKPVDDPVLLRIKTAMGHYREPRHGEDPAGSGAHPLKVKTAEGYGPDSWDTPVWMTPLD